MTIVEHAIAALIATIVLSTTLSGSRALGLTRIDMPFMLGTIFTGNRDKAKVVGFAFHIANGWAFAFVYFGAFRLLHNHSIFLGALGGLVQALFVLVAGVSALPYLHPRMASEEHGPDPTRMLEPPGFLALSYGTGTPIVTILAHILYGILLAAFYH